MSNSYQPGKKTISMYQYNYSWMNRVERDNNYKASDSDEQWAKCRVDELVQALIPWEMNK